MHEFTIPMALFDFVPVLFFLASAILLQRDLYNKMSKGAFAIFSAGTIVVFFAGFFKAIWKLLYAAGVCDFELLNKCFFPMQTLGFVLAALGLVAMMSHKQGNGVMFAAVATATTLDVEPLHEAAEAVKPAVYSGTMLFVVLMVLGVAAVCGCMASIAKKQKKPLAAVLYLVSLVFILGMGYLASKNKPGMDWVEELVNAAGQGLFFAATLMLHRSGLAEPAKA